MFAFLIWDAQERVLFGARDPFGIKPLFFATGAGGVAFASEKKSLLELAGHARPRRHTRLDRRPCAAALPDPAVRAGAGDHAPGRSGGSSRARTFTVRPGGEVEQERYFHPAFTEHRRPPDGRAAPRIADVLRDSVAKHMRADVTVGAFLSGGIDSTAIAALAKEHNPDLITFTTGFEREGYSEVDVAAESAAAIGVRHVVRTVKPDEMMEALPLIVWYLDDPVADPALVPLWFIAREARRHVKVVLSGEGADELFGGYTIYREPLSLAPFERVPGALRRLLGRASRPPAGGHARQGPAAPRRPAARAALLRQRPHLPRRPAGGRPAPATTRGARTPTSPRRTTASPRSWDPVARMQHVDLFTWLRGDILVKADKMTMANSLELRVPFLDPEVFAVASGAAAAVEDRRGHHEAGAAPGAGRHRPAARAAPAQAGLPGADPALAARRDVRLGAAASSATPRPTTSSTSPPSGGCSTRTAPGRSTTAGGSGRCWSS